MSSHKDYSGTPLSRNHGLRSGASSGIADRPRDTLSILRITWQSWRTIRAH